MNMLDRTATVGPHLAPILPAACPRSIVFPHDPQASLQLQSFRFFLQLLNCFRYLYPSPIIMAIGQGTSTFLVQERPWTVAGKLSLSSYNAAGTADWLPPNSDLILVNYIIRTPKPARGHQALVAKFSRSSAASSCKILAASELVILSQEYLSNPNPTKFGTAMPKCDSK